MALVKKEYTNVIVYHDVQDLSSYFRVSRVGMGKALSRRQRKEIWEIIEDFRNHLSSNGYVHDLALYNLLTHYLRENPSEEYGHCIVDELQDLSNIHLRFIRSLIESGPNDLFMVGDPLQNIYDRKINFTKAKIHIRGKRSRRLRINYRTTEEIRRRAINLIKGLKFDDFDGSDESMKEYLSLYHGQDPEVKMHDSAEVKYERVFELISMYSDDEKHNYSSICIGARLKSDLKSIKSQLHAKSIPYYDVRDQAGDHKGIHLCTLHSLKGLEYKNIILIGVNKNTFPYFPYDYESWDEQEKITHNRKERSLMYVALTRGRETVDILGVGEVSSLLA